MTRSTNTPTSRESELLESIYNRGMAGRRVDYQFACYENDELFLSWSPRCANPGRIRDTTSSNEKFSSPRSSHDSIKTGGPHRKAGSLTPSYGTATMMLG